MMTIGAPPVRALFDRVGSEGQAKLRDTLATIIEADYGSGPIITTNTATIGTGIAS